jgi:hypothetical protein
MDPAVNQQHVEHAVFLDHPIARVWVERRCHRRLRPLTGRKRMRVYAGITGRSSEGQLTLLLTLALPRLNEQMTTAMVRSLYLSEGAAVTPNSKFLDLAVDLSATVEHDCPPVSYYRIVLRDRAWLRRLFVATGQTIEAGEPLALFSTEPDEALDGVPGRAARTSIAGILAQPDWPDAEF